MKYSFEKLEDRLLLTEVTFRGVSYGGSAFGDSVIAASKTALLPGETAAFNNVTSYTSGLNRVVIDVDGLASSLLTADDFQFRVGNTDDPSEWLKLSGESAIPLPTISVAPPVGRLSRITLTWPDNAIENTWLQVVLNANANTGLSLADTFYIGNQIGEVNGSVNIEDQLNVNSFDTAKVRLNQSAVVGIDDFYDVDRNGMVDAADATRVRQNQTISGLQMFTPSLYETELIGVSALGDIATVPTMYADDSSSTTTSVNPGELKAIYFDALDYQGSPTRV